MLILWILIWIASLVEAGTRCSPICKCQGAAIDCRNNELTSLPEQLNEEVKILDLSYNNFVSIPYNISSLQNLNKLILNNNQISALGNQSLQRLDNLVNLDLSRNNFRTSSDIFISAFVPTKSLQRLDLSYNILKEFPKIKSASITNLILINCSIRKIQYDDLRDLPNLTTLELGDNTLSIITPLKSKNLQLLNLTHSGISEIYMSALDNLPNLKHLFIGNNPKLKSFKASSVNLETLNIANSNVERLPENNLTKLMHLNMYGNSLKYINSKNFIKMPNVKYLILSNNIISSIDPYAFSKLKLLRELDLSYNTISNLDDYSFVHNFNLEVLTICHNYLKELIPFNITRVKYLDMSENEITIIKHDSLLKMPALTFLNLSRNEFAMIPNNFSSKSLISLDVTYCRITNLRNETFIGLPNLKKLYLIGNRLVEIKPVMLPKLSVLKLADNSWRCDCASLSFQELFQYLIKVTSDIQELSCQSPENLEGMTWEEACGGVWYHIGGKKTETAWLYCTTIIIVFTLIFTIIMYNINVARKKRRRVELQREREREQNRLRRMQLRQAETAASNAPDPRELENPPSYSEAIAMPPLGSTTSLASRKSKGSISNNNNERKSKPKTRRKRRRSKAREQTTSTSSRHDDSSDYEPSSVIVMESDV